MQLKSIPDHHAPSFSNIHTSNLLFQRIPWLIITLFFDSFSASIMQKYEKLFQHHLILSIFLPMITTCACNAGNQPNVLFIRDSPTLSSEEKQKRIVQEFKTSLLTATILSFFTFFRILFQYPNEVNIAGYLALCLFLLTLFAVSIGLFVTYCLSTLNIDPANASPQILSTVVDIVGVSIICWLSFML
tara:strand:+ start:88 stop:651 length:564 start_codon:yes stop_codon:yes gene_type:complete